MKSFVPLIYNPILSIMTTAHRPTFDPVRLQSVISFSLLLICSIGTRERGSPWPRLSHAIATGPYPSEDQVILNPCPRIFVTNDLQDSEDRGETPIQNPKTSRLNF